MQSSADPIFLRGVFIRLFSLFCVTLALCVSPTRADDGDIEKELAGKGAVFTKTRGVTTGFSVKDCSAWTEVDFKNLAQLARLQNLDFGGGLTDQGVALIAPLADVEVIQTNKAQVTDAGVKAFAQLKKLRVLKFFHPGKSFTGTGLADLAPMASLQSLTVAGSDFFGDEGMAAVAKLVQLREFRCWHDAESLEGVAKLKGLTNLRNINLGQHLSYKPPATVSDPIVAILVEMKSLESIQLSEARLKLSALAELKELPSLKTLTLDGIDIPEADVEQLKKELPNVQIKWTKPPESYVRRIKSLFGAE
jgi:hypothetical protein